MTDTRYKMFKSGKMWMVAGAAVLAMVPAAAQSANADDATAATTAATTAAADTNVKHETAKEGEKPVAVGTVTTPAVTNADGSKTTTTTTTTEAKNADGSLTQTYKSHAETVSTVKHTNSKNQVNANGVNDTTQLYNFEANGKAQTFTVTGDRTKAFPKAMGTEAAHSQVNFKVVTTSGDPQGPGVVMAEGTLYANKAGENTTTFTFTPQTNGKYAFQFEQVPLSDEIGQGNDVVWNDIQVTSTKTTSTDSTVVKDFPAAKPVTPTPDSQTPKSETPKSEGTQSTTSESQAPASTSTSSAATPAKPAAKPAVAPAAKKAAASALPATAEKASNNEAGLIALAAATVAASFGVLSYKRKH
ncbi:KxYKxGKxW signal peptide domain-containing protein [Convivina praedatoris]|uniref:KxYKxGKxW signal peptide domain-containing protein n=1 Tax=Convivina praedatoris TaxID=2880963 RepID=UPI00200D22E9|nr:KxYKxGKxW signal peptide domain-containing protein [Convivina sp. LMG 32447]CAH1855052.1 hypothetical protein R078138_01046 [Convivina sp. LMG 32447]